MRETLATAAGGGAELAAVGAWLLPGGVGMVEPTVAAVVVWDVRPRPADRGRTGVPLLY